jgi:nucleoid-associated protein EbfC
MMNMQKMMKQAQAMQQKMLDMQAQMEQREFVGKAGGGMVAITINGKGIMLKASLDESLMNKDEKEMLEDLIVAAFNDAKAKVDSESQNELSSLTSGMGLPAGFKMPF